MAEATAPEQHRRGPGRPFQPGQSGNPAGRALGSRNKLGEAFIKALHDDFQTHGVAAVIKVREERPQDYLKVIASLLPKEFHVKDEAYDDLTDEQLDHLLGEVRSTHARVAREKARAREVAASSVEGPDSVH